MTLALYDRVQQTGTANTTVSFTLSGSVAGYQSFVAVGNGNTTYYGSFDTSGNWEVGLGTYSTTGPTLTRTTILSSSNGGLAVTFSGTVNVFVTYPSEKAVYLDASGNITPASVGPLTVTSLTNAGLTSGRVTYAGTAGLLQDSANMVFDGSTLTTLNSAYTGTLTGGTGIVNLGSGQFYKDASGNVGIGQTNPGQKLDVSSSGDIQVRIGNSVTGAQFTYDIGRVASTGLMQFYGNQSGATGYIFSGINGERMRIDSSGRVLIGTTNTDPTFNRVNGLNLNPSGSIFSRSTTGWDCGINSTSGANIGFYTDNGSSRVTGGNISTNGSVTSYNVISDYRLKQNIAPLQNSLSKVLQLKPCSYNYIEGNQYSEGFIAHELQAIIPEAVTGEKDAVNEDGSIKAQGVDTSFLVATLTASIQELKAIVDAQAERIAKLEAK